MIINSIPAVPGNKKELDLHVSDINNPHNVTADQAGAIPSDQKGKSGGIAELDSDGKVPMAQLPSMDYDRAGSAAAVQDDLNSHKEDTDLHVTGDKQERWDAGAQEASEAKELATSAQSTADGAKAVADEAYELASKGGGGSGKKYATFVVGHMSSGHTLDEVDYLCDGVDDQEEINTAIQSLPEGGGKVVIREGTYHLSAQIIIDRENVMFEGMSNSTVLSKESAGSGTYGIYVTADYCKISNIHLDGNDHTGRGIYLTSSNNTIEGNTCYNNYEAISLNSSSNNTITGNTCSNTRYEGIYLGSSSSNNTITGNTCSNNKHGIFLNSSSNNNIIAWNTCSSNSSYGIHLSISGGNTITGNTCNNNDLYGIYFSGNSDNTVTGNTCSNNRSYGVLLLNSSNNTITGNICNSNSSGIRLSDGGDNNTITGNTSSNNTYGIFLMINSNNITGNSCSDNNYGIFLGGANNLIAVNCCLDNTFIAIQDSGTNNTIELNKTS